MFGTGRTMGKNCGAPLPLEGVGTLMHRNGKVIRSRASSAFSAGLCEGGRGAATVLVNEFDAGGFECAPNDIEGRATRLTGNYAGPNRRLGFAALQSLLKRHANKTLIGNPLFFCPTAHGV